MDTLESVLFVCREVMVFRIPPRSTSTLGYKADSWNSDPNSLIWRGRLRIIESSTMGESSDTAKVELRLEDSQTGDLFASCPYEDTQVGSSDV
jgi:hypothetical protein